jgi:hypothetical protein
VPNLRKPLFSLREKRHTLIPARIVFADATIATILLRGNQAMQTDIRLAGWIMTHSIATTLDADAHPEDTDLLQYLTKGFLLQVSHRGGQSHAASGAVLRLWQRTAASVHLGTHVSHHHTDGF